MYYVLYVLLCIFSHPQACVTGFWYAGMNYHL